MNTNATEAKTNTTTSVILIVMLTSFKERRCCNIKFAFKVYPSYKLDKVGVIKMSTTCDIRQVLKMLIMIKVTKGVSNFILISQVYCDDFSIT